MDAGAAVTGRAVIETRFVVRSVETTYPVAANCECGWFDTGKRASLRGHAHVSRTGHAVTIIRRRVTELQPQEV